MLYVLIPLAVVLLAVAVWALLWAIRTGQFDDLESHGWSVVLDDDQKPPPQEDEEDKKDKEDREGRDVREGGRTEEDAP
jgi:cbb3-type cytochrome oxidase maturation protein